MSSRTAGCRSAMVSAAWKWPGSMKASVCMAPSTSQEPVENPRILVAGIGVRQVLDLTIDELSARRGEHVASLSRHLDWEHPVERAMDQVDRPVLRLGE